ncbi:NADPH-dependent 1-acyldihydroxyacetone phosphate reductase [Suhomyces tanzawaensis NRRL Y-17324]|uniref:NADPH-dependent 1-acyldihydroxyacetone phosphate reductase n=1 Tax=Suhomyces tanzawaensis NRRL Y-17324 TaxID=984487 RepID=A0A1E4SC07_9ASCO|nr:NADPH-dependent 1-acyldihydroxyacetone phosphate reductase [Suhomyces tanzawaensis NRRL Y-17324]ODV77025.1 NADPH-dependent 1-acyldihydroxyacetone phosphate reductase [Suhomyces tanzawaensis NRRL Y-17324]
MSERQKVAVVTGASSGIGYATSIEFAKRGYKVFAGARRVEPMEPLREHGVIPIQLDITLSESVREAKRLILQHNNGEEYVDFLFNNAGQSCSFAALDVTDELMKQCYDVNVLGQVRMVREFSPWLINSKGVIGFTSSITGYLPFPWSSMYCSSKAALTHYAACLRLELKPFDVKVINFVTGGVKTNVADTRPLPTDSIYNVPGMQESLLERAQMSNRNNPMDAGVYAQQIVTDFEDATLSGPLNLARGTKAWILCVISRWVPHYLIEAALIRKFKMMNVFVALKEKFSKAKLS